MAEILQLRKKIDIIDEQVLNSLKERIEICKIIGKKKQNLGLPIIDPQREEEKYRSVMERALELSLDPHIVKSIYQKIITTCRHSQDSNPDIK